MNRLVGIILRHAIVAVSALVGLPVVWCGVALAANTSAWSVNWLPVPSSAVTVPLSCSSVTACTAVATYYPFPSVNSDVLFALHWNGAGWARQVMPEPAGSSPVLIGGISCPSSSTCVAVGGFAAGGTTGPYTPLAERWNGSAWSIVPVPAPRRPGLSSRLLSVSCTSTAACTAVGESVSRRVAGHTTPLVERWDGTAWSSERAPRGQLMGVSCASQLACTAVGDAGNQTLGEHWDGTTWSIEPDPDPRRFGGPQGENQLTSVSCPSRHACTAVGDSTWGTGFADVRVTLAERWNGSRWSVQPTPDPIQLDQLSSVSCPSSRSCVAVGDHTDRAGDTTRPLVERWQGGSWSVLRAPRRLSTGKSADPTLLSVVCFTSGGCVAVGDAQGGPFSLRFP